jgi:hypothetical protein
MKKVGFLSFGHRTPSSQSQTRSAADALLQSIELAIAAEELGADARTRLGDDRLAALGSIRSST